MLPRPLPLLPPPSPCQPVFPWGRRGLMNLTVLHTCDGGASGQPGGHGDVCSALG